MTTVLKDAFVDGWLDQGRLGKARDFLMQLLSKKFGMPAATRERVAGCTDLSTINTWFDRAITAESLDEVFAE